MKIQCNVCEVAEAKVLCCADEAALCLACDEKVHAANKLASKHQRVSLYCSASQMPKCDICQEAVGYFFCLEDRALLCRKCDLSIHTANTFVSAHQRFLLTGVKVALEPTELGASMLSGQSHVDQKTMEGKPCSLNKRSASTSLEGQCYKVVPAQGERVGNFASNKMPFTGGSATGSVPQWHLDDILGLNEFSQNYGYIDNGSSKADSGKFGDSDCSPILRGIEEEHDGDDCLGQVPDASWAVPQIPSPPTASGLYWPKSNQDLSDTVVYVPDIYSPMQCFYDGQPNGGGLKRRRQF